MNINSGNILIVILSLPLAFFSCIIFMYKSSNTKYDSIILHTQEKEKSGNMLNKNIILIQWQTSQKIQLKKKWMQIYFQQ
jgi:hypothetical protein